MSEVLKFDVVPCADSFGVSKVFHGLDANQATRVMEAEAKKQSMDAKNKPMGKRRVTFTREFYAPGVLAADERVRYTVVSAPALDPKKEELAEENGRGYM